MVLMQADELSSAILGSKIACSSGQVTITDANVWYFYFTVEECHFEVLSWLPCFLVTGSD